MSATTMTAGEFKQAGTVLRLRQDTRARLTYKDGEKLLGKFGSSRFEAEVEVSDYESMATILDKLGFHAVMGYEKYRTTYQLDDAEVTLDEMPYGNFVEIEGEQEAIGRVLDTLQLDDARRMTGSYTVLFEIVRKNLGLDFSDLTFANFEGIDVPESAFDEPADQVEKVQSCLNDRLVGGDLRRRSCWCRLKLTCLNQPEDIFF